MTAYAHVRPDPVSVHDVLDRLQGVRPSGDSRWMARCPAHGDKRQSLSVRAGDDGRTLLHCFAGCEFLDIVKAIGLEPQQLFAASNQPFATRVQPRKRDAVEEGRTFAAHLQRRMTIPPPKRLQRELEFIGRLLYGGPTALKEIENFNGDDLQLFAARILFSAMRELTRQGTPRRWFSVFALCREIDAVAGKGSAKRYQLYEWARLALEAAR